MYEGSVERRTTAEYRRPRSRSWVHSRPDRVALWAFAVAIFAMFAAAASAEAGSGGVGSAGGGSAKYGELWDSVSDKNKRWARRTSECESGGDPNAVSPGGTYRGAFQFSRPTWRGAPKSPGGDPIDYSWRTQAVVAVYLKKAEGTGPWPNCG
jgi:hypothetical protein